MSEPQDGPTGPNGKTHRPASALCGLVLVLWLTIDGILVPSAALASVVGGGSVLVVARRHPQRTDHRTLAVAALATLVAVAIAVRTTPLAGVSLPDIGQLGEFTYLATEILFGAVTLALLVRAGSDAMTRTARTVAVVYPVAYVWDWYTLSVGVFAIPLRTGVEFVGIPLEEHIFMLVVPGFVLAVHETLGSMNSNSSADGE